MPLNRSWPSGLGGTKKETEMRRLVIVTAAATLVVYLWPTAEAKSFCSGLWVAMALVAGK